MSCICESLFNEGLQTGRTEQLVSFVVRPFSFSSRFFFRLPSSRGSDLSLSSINQYHHHPFIIVRLSVEVSDKHDRRLSRSLLLQYTERARRRSDVRTIVVARCRRSVRVKRTSFGNLLRIRVQAGRAAWPYNKSSWLQTALGWFRFSWLGTW